MKLTKAHIEVMAQEIMDYLLKKGLDMDVYIYYNNKRIHNSSLGLVVEEGLSPLDYFEYVNHDHILSMSFEGALYDSMNYSGRGIDGFEKIFEKYGLYYELGNAWNLSAYPINDTMEIECTKYKKPKKTIYLNPTSFSSPSELGAIMDIWYTLSKEVGDKGSCVLGAGFEFEWKDDKYFMPACSPYQGSISWETHKDAIQKMLENLGATSIRYDWGRMD